MKYYKNPVTNALFAYESDGSQDEFIPADLVAISDEEAGQIRQADAQAAQALIPVEVLRRAAYEAEADPLFFKAQRGEATLEEWQAKIAEIKARFPKE